MQLDMNIRKNIQGVVANIGRIYKKIIMKIIYPIYFIYLLNN